MNIKFKGKRVDNGQLIEGNFFYWIKRGVKIPIIGDGVKNGSVMGFEVDITTVRIINDASEKYCQFFMDVMDGVKPDVSANKLGLMEW